MKWLTIGWTVAAVACAPFPPDVPMTQGRWPAVSAHPAIGCWALSAPGIDTMLLRAPGIVRFTDSAQWRQGSTPKAFVLVPGPGVQHGSGPRFTVWAPTDSAGRIAFTWGNGYYGVGGHAVVTSDSLRGTMHWFSDVVTPTPPPTIALTGIRVPCGSVGL